MQKKKIPYYPLKFLYNFRRRPNYFQTNYAKQATPNCNNKTITTPISGIAPKIRFLFIFTSCIICEKASKLFSTKLCKKYHS